MALISQKFKNDTKTNSIDVEPVIVLADSTDNSYTVLDIYSNSTLNLKDQDSNTLKQSRPIINKISSIKNSIDYESKNIRVNTFRFSIHNYHDITKKLTSSDSYSLLSNNSLMGKNVILFYKTQTCENLFLLKDTTLFDTGSYENDPLCSIMFYGVINRVTQTDDIVTIQAEDLSYEYIKDKEVPLNNVGGLPENIKMNMTDRDDTQPIPMVFGAVDHAPALSYKTNRSNNKNLTSLGFIHDADPIFGFNNLLKKGTNYVPFHLFVQDGDDYVVIPYNTDKDSFLARSFLFETIGYTDTHILPEIHEEAENSQSIYAIGYLPANNVVGDISGNNNLDVLYGQTSEANLVSNTESITQSYTQRNMWTKFDIEPNPVEPFIIPPQTFGTDTTGGTARWLLIGLTQDITICRTEGQYQIFTELIDGSPQMSGTTNNIPASLYIKPLNPEYIKELELQVHTNDLWRDYLLNDTTIYGITFPNLSFGELILPQNNSIITSAGVNIGEPQYIYNAGEVEHDNLKEYYENSSNVNKVLLFDFYKTTDINESIRYGHSFNNLSFQHIKEISNYANETFYASIRGRKDHASTENMDYLEDIQGALDINPSTAINGADGTLPDFELVVNEWDEYFHNMYCLFPSDESLIVNQPDTFLYKSLFNSSSGYTNEERLDFGINPNYTAYNHLGLTYKQFTINDDTHIVQSPQIISNVLHGLMKKLYTNIIHYILLETDINSWLRENVAIDYNYPEEVLNGMFENGNRVAYFLFVPYQRELTNPTYSDNDWLNAKPLMETALQEFHIHRRALLRRIFKYLYQNNLNEEDSVDSLITGYTYEWDSFGIGLDDLDRETYVSNLKSFLDDTINTINLNIYDKQSTLNSDGTDIDTNSTDRAELYVWDDNPTFYNMTSPHMVQLYNYINYDSMMSECFSDLDVPYQTSGFVEKPVDIMINILRKELGFGLNKYAYDSQLIQDSREYYQGFKMGFCIDESTAASQLIQNISKECKSYFNFTNEGRFGLVTIKDNYEYDDINHFIDKEDVIAYKITRTKREKLITSNKYFFGYDNGQDRYKYDTELLNVNDLYPEYNGFDYYNIVSENTYKEKELRYHTDLTTARNFQYYDLGQNINQHLVIGMDLPLNYSIEVGDVIHIPLLNNNLAFGIDYSKLEYLNGQGLYPAWIVTGVELSTEKVKITAMQLHHIKQSYDDYPVFNLEGTPSVILGNTKEFNSTYVDGLGEPVRNWNYINPDLYEGLGFVVEDSGVEIPYGDTIGDGSINVVDVLKCLSHILNVGTNLTSEEIIRADYNQDNQVDVADVVSIVDVILASGE